MEPLKIKINPGSSISILLNLGIHIFFRVAIYLLYVDFDLLETCQIIGIMVA